VGNNFLSIKLLERQH